MPDDPVVWIVFIVVAGIVLSLGIWLGRGLLFRKNKDGLAFELKAADPKHVDKKARIIVADNAEITNSKVNDIGGLIIEGNDTGTGYKEEISVLSRGRIKDTHVADIAGVKKKET